MTKAKAMSSDSQNLAWHRDQQVSRQWRTFLTALAAELPSQLGDGPAQLILQGVGNRMAQAIVLPVCQSLADAEVAINSVMRDMGWGWVQLVETDHQIEIAVNEPPMGTPETGSWLCPVLEGLFTTWMQSLGAGTHLEARVGAPMQPGLIVMSFGPPTVSI